MSAATAGSFRSSSPRHWRTLVWIRGRIPNVLAFIALIGIWQLLVVFGGMDPILFPGPALVLQELVEVWNLGLLPTALVESVVPLAIGMGFALAAGLVLGLLIGSSPWADMIASPYLWGLFATPRIALAPLMVLWFGFGNTTKIWLVFLSAVIPVMLSCKDGIRTVDDTLVRAAVSFCARKRDVYLKVVAPNTLPSIASGIRNGLSRGFVGLLVVEMLVGSGGVGTEVMRATRQFNTARTFAFVLVLVAMAMLFIILSRWLEEFASRWREEVGV